MNPSDRLNLLEHYAEQGIALLPLEDGKGTRRMAWQDFRIPHGELRATFADPGLNVGALLGMPSRGLVDVDLDCPEALQLAPLFMRSLPPAMTFGRASKPRSHYLYRIGGACPSIKIMDWTGQPKPPTLVELRGERLQTMVPPSVHPSSEEVEWTQDADEPDAPQPVAVDALTAAVRALGAACVIARHVGMDAALAFAADGTEPAGLPPLVRRHIRVHVYGEAEQHVQPRRVSSSTTTSGWIATLNSRGPRAVAEACELERLRGDTFACPACGSEKRGRSDKRGAIGFRRDGMGWHCHACKAKGDAVKLAAWALLGGVPLRGEREAWTALRTRASERGLL